MDYKGFFQVTDFKEKLTNEAERLTKQFPDIPVEEKNEIVESLTDAYVRETGYQPNNYVLGMLRNWILREDFSVKSPDKITNTEYPVLNYQQQKTRERREKSEANIEILAITGPQKTCRRDSTKRKDVS